MRLRVLVITLVLGAAGAAGWFFVFPRTVPVAPERLASPQVGNIVRGILAVGKVEPRTRVDIKSKANGIIRKFYVDVNDQVTAGKTIIELDKEILQARVAEADGRLKQAHSAVNLAQSEVKRVEAEMRDPELLYAEKAWGRVQQLGADGVVSVDELDLARERFDKAQHRLQLLAAQLESAKAAHASAEGKVKEVQAQADLATQELNEATIVSPIEGVVLYRYLEEGDSVSSIRSAGGNATLVMTLGDLSELYVDGQVDEVDVGTIMSEQRTRAQLEARVKVQSYKSLEFAGRVVRVTPLGLEDDNGIVTFEVRITIENPQKLLLANMTANALIVLEEKKNVLLVSQGALINEEKTGKGRYLLVFDPKTGASHRREVVVGISDGSQVEIAGGITPDEKILIP